MTLTLSRNPFIDGGTIPKAYAQVGENKSPPLRWQGALDGTKSFVFVVADPGAPVGTVTHRVVLDIPADSDSLLGGLETDRVPQGSGDMGHTDYDEPELQKGHGPHRYHFRLAALDTGSLGLADNPHPNAVKKAARSHVLAETGLVGTFESI